MSKSHNPGDQPPTVKPWEHAKGGLGSASDPLSTRFVASLDHDRRLYRHDIEGSIAHARMLCQVGLVTNDELAQIEQGLSQIRGEIEAAGPDYGAAWPGWDIELEDVHMCIEAALIQKIGDPARKLHTGRSRNDQVALDLKLWIGEASSTLTQRLNGLFQAFVTLADRDGQIVMPAYTHLQRAQPIVVGGELIAWLTAFDRAAKRLEALQEVNNHNPLGSGAVAGSALPLDRTITADTQPVGTPTPSSIDATASRDAAIDFVYAMAMISMTLSRWAEQWIIYASSEFGFVQVDGRYTTGSSMMPQKANPDMLELIRGRCGGVYGDLIALLTICKGLTVGYNRDLQEDKTHVFRAYDCVADCIDMAARIVATTKFDETRIKADLDRGYLDATSLAEYLVTKSVPFRTAHQVVGALVHQCQQDGAKPLRELTPDQVQDACKSNNADGSGCGEDMYQWLGAEQAAKRYSTYGNAGLQGFKHQLEQWRNRVASH